MNYAKPRLFAISEQLFWGPIQVEVRESTMNLNLIYKILKDGHAQAGTLVYCVCTLASNQTATSVASFTKKYGGVGCPKGRGASAILD